MLQWYLSCLSGCQHLRIDRSFGDFTLEQGAAVSLEQVPLSIE
jgi:hypothetical protein